LFFRSNRKQERLQIKTPNQSGSVIVIVALLMTLLLGIMAFSMDLGYLNVQSNQYQNAVDAAALAAVRRLCDGDWEQVARRIVIENGLDAGQYLLVDTGFYDARDEYDKALGQFADFGTPPDGEYVNAVRVRYDHPMKSLSGLSPDTPVVAQAVAYLQRIDMAGLDPYGYVRPGHNSVWDHTVFFANGSIQYPRSASTRGGTYRTPAFNDCSLLSAGEVFACPVQVETHPWGLWSTMTVQWNDGVAQSDEQIHTGLDPITEIRPVDEETLAYWRERADTVYTPDQAGQDNVFYGKGNSIPIIGYAYFVDPADGAGAGRRTIFFDAGDEPGSVLIGPWSGTTLRHPPNGYTIANLTFVATCPIHIINLGNVTVGYPELHVGGEANEQAIFISAGDIKVYPDSSSQIVFDGAVFRTGGDFILYLSGGDRLHRMRVIADGSIYGDAYSLYTGDHGMYGIKNDSRFGPPCPPGLARLGRLE